MKDKSGLTRREALKLLGAGATAVVGANEFHSAASAESSPPQTQVIVVGAGFAGLCAARVLSRQGRKVVVLEARDRVGGRVKAAKIAGRAIDAGGMWVGPTQTRLLDLIKEYGLHTVPQFETGTNIAEFGGKRFTARGEAIGFDPQTQEEYDRIIRDLTRLSDQVPLDAPWNMPRAEEYDQITADDWFLAQTKNSAILGFLRAFVRAIFTADPYQISFLYFLFYLRSGDNYDSLYGFENAAQAWTVQETMHQVAVLVAEELGKVIVLNAPVRSISQDSTGVLVTSDAGNWRCEYAIVAVPLPLSVRIAYKPELPPQRDILAQHMPMGSVIKYWVAYETPFWSKRGLNGMLQSDQPPSEFISGDFTPSEGRPGLLAGFMEAHNSMAWTGRSTEERKKVVVERLISFLGPEAANPIDYEDQDWPADPWSRGCYGPSMAPGIMTTVGKVIRQPHGRIHWAGTETSTKWTGYIDGAIRSGERAADEVLARLKTQVQRQ
ncbi:MAG TPA: flavin monoamine oxidase family protein [Candidatus Sulfotelmatobacter sp.]|nr:flavin monoamine oxidase family protein [Candidatus Sulfotelmatobacter sp.]